MVKKIPLVEYLKKLHQIEDLNKLHLVEYHEKIHQVESLKDQKKTFGYSSHEDDSTLKKSWKVALNNIPDNMLEYSREVSSQIREYDEE